MSDWLPRLPTEGPPLPKFLDIYWPWYTPPGAGFSVSNLVISPAEVNPGQTVTITCTVTNTGAEAGTYTVKMEGDFIAQQTVTLAPEESKTVSFEVTPTVAKTYNVSVDGLSGSFRVIAPPIDQFYLPPTFTKAKITEQWQMPPYYYVMQFECPITNKGGSTGTHTITVSNNHPGDLPPWTFQVTLAPGQTYLWTYSQFAIWPMTFYLAGDWVRDNHSEGAAT